MVPATQTKYFNAAVGVFEGGGVLGIAYAGAYEVAFAAGVRFQGTAGTSVGAVMAALIAAGMSPAEIKALLTAESFPQVLASRLLPVSNTLKAAAATVAWTARRFGLKDISSRHVTAVLRPGVFAHTAVQEWLEGILSTHLGVSGRPVTFKDLPFPLAVLATKLGSGGPHVWHSAAHPSESVARAVTASCAVPFFFETVFDRQAQAHFVDGGLISNLPIHLTSELPMCHGLPVLAFRLSPTAMKRQHERITSIELIESLIDGAIDGHTAIELGCGQPAHVIDIQTPAGASFIDFSMNAKQKDQLIQAGVAEAKRFFTNETDKLRDSGFLDNRLRHASASFIHAFTIERLLETAKKSTVYIRAGDASWLERLAPCLLWLALVQGVSIKVLLQRTPSDDQKTTAEKLARLGCDVKRLRVGTAAPAPVLVLTIRGPESAATEAWTIEKPVGNESPSVSSGKRDMREARWMTRTSDAGLVSALIKHFEVDWDQAETLSKAQEPRIQEIGNNRVVQALKSGVIQYGGKDVTIAETDVDVNTTQSLSMFVEDFKRLRVKCTVEILQHVLDDYKMFDAIWIQGTTTVIAPPIIEQLKGELAVMDGTHRIKWCLDNNIQNVRAIVVKGVATKAPASRAHPWKHVRSSMFRTEFSERFSNFDASAWREYDQALNVLGKTLLTEHGSLLG